MNKRHYRQNGAGALALPIAAGGGSTDSIEGDGGAASIKGDGSAASIEGAAGPLPLKGLTPLTKIGFANASIPSPFPTKNEPPMRGPLTLPEFVPKTAGSRFGAMILELKTGRKRNGGLKRIKHTRKSPLSRSNSFLAQKHSPNQNLRKSSAPLCPPNPRFVLIATFTSALRATFGT